MPGMFKPGHPSRSGAAALLLGFLMSFPGVAGAGSAVPDCGLAQPRHDRSEPLVFPQTNKINCHQDRTIGEDQAFFGGEFRSDTGRLTTRFLDGGQVRYTAALAEPGCTATILGTAKIAADGLTAADGATRLSFTDGGVDLTLGSGTCAGLSEELFYDHGTSVLAEPNDEGSGCDLQVNGMDKEEFIRFYYAFKRAVAKDDRKAVAGMVQYPTTALGPKNRRIVLKRPADLLAHYAAVFPECVRQAILQQKISRLFCRDQGAMFGTGEIWIAGSSQDGLDRTGKPKDSPWPPKIITINADACPVMEPIRSPVHSASKSAAITSDQAAEILLAPKGG